MASERASCVAAPQAAERPTPASEKGVAPDLAQTLVEHQARITRLCGRILGWETDVDDVVQDTFYRAIRAKASFRGGSNPLTWLSRIAINACRSHMRRRALRRGVLSLFGGAAPESLQPEVRDDPDSLAVAAQRAKAVRHAVATLPGKYREVVVLRYLEGYSVADVAEVVGIQRNTVEVRLGRARRMLADRLGSLAEVLA